MRNRIILLAGIAVVVVAVATAAALWTTGLGETASLALGDLLGGKSAEAPKPSAEDGPAPKGVTPVSNPAKQPGTSTASPDGSGSEQPAVTPDGGQNGSKPATGPAAAGGMELIVKFWNDTEGKPTASCLVSFGPSTYKPDTSKASGEGVVGPFPVGKKAQLIVFPDGPRGNKVVVPILVKPQMQARSEKDAIHVEISDDRVRVLGNAVTNFNQIFPRFED